MTESWWVDKLFTSGLSAVGGMALGLLGLLAWMSLRGRCGSWVLGVTVATLAALAGALAILGLPAGVRCRR